MAEPGRASNTEHLLEQQRVSWRRGERILVESYLEQQPTLAGDVEAVLDLIGNEMILREQAGQVPTLQEYQQRFPQLAAALELHFAVDRAMYSGSESPTTPQGDQTEISSDVPGAARIPGYEILEVLGRGGMGIVYKARQLSLDRVVALKMIRGSAEPDNVVRFRREAEAVARLQHVNIVQIYEIGEHAGEPYCALEYIQGGTLADRIADLPLPVRQAAVITETLARAMHTAHQQGIIHRDLKPANVLLTTEGIPKITDFGLVKKLTSESVSTAQTQPGAILGTPSYMAPEQAAGTASSRLIGPAADVYALGAILYEMLTRRPPFRGDSPMDIVLKVVSEEPASPRHLCPELPRDLETICLKCLEKEPAKRYGSSLELADDLRRFLDDVPIQARPTGRWERSRKWMRRHPAVVVASTMGVLLLIAGLLGLEIWWQKEEHRQNAEEATSKYQELQRQEEAKRQALAKMLEDMQAGVGEVQISLFWDNKNDLDLHVICPSGEKIDFGNRHSKCGGQLDLDMNANSATASAPAVENVVWPTGKAPRGLYEVYVDHFANHGKPDSQDPTPYMVRTVVRGQTSFFNGEVVKADHHRNNVFVCKFRLE